MASILIVDDVVDTCTMLQRLFVRCGHVASCLFEGSGVVEALRTQPFQLVLLDVMMPGMDGFAVLRAIRNHPEPKVASVPVAMYSAMSDPRAMQRALVLGANEWIVKGTPFPLLHQRLDRFLEPGGTCA
jgi:CheY-like chemotaxis protein